jgi:hypothetical protein
MRYWYFCSRLWVRNSVVLGVVLWSFSSQADKNTSEIQDRPVASALFRKGLEEMKQKDFGKACPDFEESYHLSQLPGTLFTLAECYAFAGKIASAVARYSDYLEVMSKRPDSERIIQRGRMDRAVARKAELEPKVPFLTLEYKKALPAKTSITRNGIEVTEVMLNTPLPVDPGKQEIVISLSDGQVHRQEIVLPESSHQSLRLVVPKLKPKPKTKENGLLLDGKEPPHTKLNPLFWVSSGITVAALATGSITGWLAMQKKQASEPDCIAGQCNAEGFSNISAMKSLGTVSTISFVVGGVGLSAVVVQLLLPSSSSKESPKAKTKTAFSFSPTSVSWGGTW